MSTSPIKLVKTRDFGSLLQDSIQFFVRNFQPLAKAVLVYVGPLMLLQGIATGLYQYDVLNFQEAILNGETSGDPFAQMMTMYGAPTFLIATFLGAVVYAMLLAVVNHYLVHHARHGGAAPDMETLRAQAFNDFLPNLGALLVSGLVMMVGFLLLFFPGIYVAVPLALIYISMKHENIGVFAAFSRCFELIRGSWWQTFGLILVLSIIIGIASMLFQLPMMISSFANLFGLTFFGSKVYLISASIFATLGAGLLNTVLVIGMAMQYFNLLVRKEGGTEDFLDDRIDQIGRDDHNA